MTKILDDETDCGLLYSVLLCRLTTPIMSDNRGICLMTFFLNFVILHCLYIFFVWSGDETLWWRFSCL